VTCWGDNAWGQIDPPSSLQAVSLVADGSNSCAIDSGGVVTCWGSRVQQLRPDFGPVTSLALHQNNLCAINNAGEAEHFGSGRSLNGPSGSVGVALGRFHACWLQPAGELVCTGAIAIFNPGLEFISAEPPGLLGATRTVVAGTGHLCALEEAGQIRCWGDNAAGQATPPATLGSAVAIAAGARNSCALMETGDARCWGADFDAASVY
jgi:alpha-tubulin suppressor-like RCC1 family protein